MTFTGRRSKPVFAGGSGILVFVSDLIWLYKMAQNSSCTVENQKNCYYLLFFFL